SAGDLSALRSIPRNDPPGAQGSPDHRVADRVFSVGAARRDRDPAEASGTGIGFVPCSPLGRGFLTGTIKKLSDLDEKDARRQRYPRFRGEACDKNQARVERVKAIAQRRHVTAGQLALAWVLAKGEDVVPIPGRNDGSTWRRMPPRPRSS